MYYIQDRNDVLDIGVSEASIYPTEIDVNLELLDYISAPPTV